MSFIIKHLWEVRPKIDLNAIPVEEHTAIGAITRLCEDLISFGAQLEDAIWLFHAVRRMPDSPDDPHQTSSWRMVAARDGAVTLYHVGWLHERLRSSFKDCPTVRAKSDMTAIREAGKAFRTAFPAFEELRHSVGHSAELAAGKDPSKNVTKDAWDHGGVLITPGAITRNIITGDTFSQSINGKTVSYTLDANTIYTIKGILDSTFAAIKPVVSAKGSQP